MNCGQAERWMDAALDFAAGIGSGAGASQTRRAAFDAHLAACHTCRRQWEALQTAEAVLRVPRPVAAPEGMLAEFRSRLEAENAAARPSPRVSRGRWAWLWPAGSLAAAGAAAALVISFGVQAPTTSVQSPAPAGRPLDRTVSTSPATGLAAPGKPQDTLQTKPAPPTRYARGRNEPEASTRRARDAGVAGPAEARLEDRVSKSIPSSTLDLHAAAPAANSLSSSGSDTLSRGLQAGPKAVAAAAPSSSEYLFGKSDKTTKSSSMDTARGDAPVTETAADLRQVQGRETSNGGYASYRYAAPTLLTVSDYIQVSVEPLPPELNVSAAVLNALQRDVEVNASETSVRELADQLGEAADVVLKVDTKVALTNVTIQQGGAPLWRVLEDAARQGGFEIYPRDNTLVLRQSSSAPSGPVASRATPNPAMAKALSEKMPLRRSMARLSKAKAPKAPAPAAELSPLRLGANLPAPDRQVWPAAWGNLPERGFAVPPATELPALALSREVASPQEIPRVRERLAAPTAGEGQPARPGAPRQK